MTTALLFAWGSTSVRHRKLQISTVNNFLSAFGKSGERATPPPLAPPLKGRRGLSVTEWGESHPTVICDNTSPQGEAMDDECSPLRSERKMDFIITSLKGRMFYENVFNQ